MELHEKNGLIGLSRDDKYRNAIEDLFLRSQIDVSISKDWYKTIPNQAIYVKLFYTGVLSIVIRWRTTCECVDNEFNEYELDYIADLIKGPEGTAQYLRRKQEVLKEIDEIKNEGELYRAKQTRGDLNIMATECAKSIATLFFEDMQELFEKLKNPQVSWFNPDRCYKTLRTDDLKNWKPGMILKGWELEKNRISEYVNPYIGFLMEKPPVRVCDLAALKNQSIKDISKEKIATTFCQQIITLSSTGSHKLRENFVLPIESVLDQNIARGNAIVIVDERCSVIAGLSAKSLSTSPLVAILGFALECIFASTESVRRYVAELERRLPNKNYDFNSYLSTEYDGRDSAFKNLCDKSLRKLITRIDLFHKNISTARALSPCDEKITQVESYVGHRTVKVAISAIKKHNLNKLIELARNKMTTFSRLLEVGYNFVSTKNQDLISARLLWYTIGLFILTVVIIGLSIKELWMD